MGSPLEVRIDGTLITPDQVEGWERRRAKAVLKTLRKALKVKGGSRDDPNDLQAQRAELLELKERLGRSDLRTALGGSMRMSAAMTKLVVRLSGAKRKQCVVEIRVADCSAKALSGHIDDLMGRDTAANRKVNLSVCPDHYLLEPRGDVLEVIETTGGAPCPAQFFLRFNDETGLKTPRDPSFPYQSAGTARLADGTVIGGVRHQFRNEGGNTLMRLMVEFPQLTLGSMIREHQWHLACEFTNWVQEILRRRDASAASASA